MLQVDTQQFCHSYWNITLDFFGQQLRFWRFLHKLNFVMWQLYYKICAIEFDHIPHILRTFNLRHTFLNFLQS